MAKKMGVSSLFGNYDINVIEGILLQEGLELQWWDKKIEKEQLLEENKETYYKKNNQTIRWREKNVVGLIFNDRGRKDIFSKVRRFFSTNHWFALREIKGVYWNLDSRLDRPKMIEDDQIEKMIQETLFNEGFVFIIKKI